MATLCAAKEIVATSETVAAPTFTGKVKIGTKATTDTVSFFGVAGVSQPTSASQAAITTLTGGKTTTNVAAKLNLLIKYCMRNRTDLVALGLIKGS